MEPSLEETAKEPKTTYWPTDRRKLLERFRESLKERQDLTEGEREQVVEHFASKLQLTPT